MLSLPMTLLGSCLTLSRAYGKDGYILSPVRFGIGVIGDNFHLECLSSQFHEAKIGASASLETEIANRFRAQQIPQCRNQQRESWLKVNTISGKYDGRMAWDKIWNGLSPVQHSGDDGRGQVVDLNIRFH